METEDTYRKTEVLNFGKYTKTLSPFWLYLSSFSPRSPLFFSVYLALSGVLKRSINLKIKTLPLARAVSDNPQQYSRLLT